MKENQKTPPPANPAAQFSRKENPEDGTELVAMMGASGGGMFSKPETDKRIRLLATYSAAKIARAMKKPALLAHLKEKFGASVESRFDEIWDAANEEIDRELAEFFKAEQIASEIEKPTNQTGT